MRFTQEQIDLAVAEFAQDAQSRTVPAAGYNKEITVYGVKDEPIQTTGNGDTGPAEPGTE